MEEKSRILLVDDDVDMVAIWTRFLEEAGFVVESASDGGEGLDKIIEGGYKLIILDEMMPKMDGMGVLEELAQRTPKQKNGPIVMITNLSRDTVSSKVMKLGAIGCITKVNVDPGAFVDQVKRFIQMAG